MRSTCERSPGHSIAAIGRSLTDRSVDLVVRQACGAAGLKGRFSAHSLRAGLATQAAEDGAPERVIMMQGGWTSIPTVRRYIRHGSLFRENVGTYLRLGPAACCRAERRLADRQEVP